MLIQSAIFNMFCNYWICIKFLLKKPEKKSFSEDQSQYVQI